ncbi:hypothetical protein TorRG33x02_121640 [Trema orientale]|uniref:Uncharacterized protein n=1 Tax=Trema orientale TaxID=63057 RepID=A0A2P5F2U9_TREOI|nr:hypothetical protein TorRG33x02_121640 [Trema orientale]
MENVSENLREKGNIGGGGFSSALDELEAPSTFPTSFSRARTFHVPTGIGFKGGCFL